MTVMRISLVAIGLLSQLFNTVAAYTPTIQDPNAPNAQDVCPGYTAANVTSTDNGLTAVLSLAGDACNAYGTDIDELALVVEYQDAHRLAVNIAPLNIDENSVSHYILSPDLVQKPVGTGSMPETDLKFDWGNSPSFWFTVTRKSTGDELFTTKGTKLIFENQFIEFITALPEDHNLSGMGEHFRPLRLTPDYVATMWSADAADPIDRNMYGTHPFYMDMRYSQGSNSSQGSSHGVFWRNAHGMESVFGSTNLTWRTIGGSIDLYFLDGPSPTDVIQQYAQGVVGLPAMHQYWTLGYHQCRWGYSNWTEVQDSINNFRSNNIPLETAWMDIDYMDAYKDFTNDPIAFRLQEAQELINGLHQDNQHFIPIVDSGVYYPNSSETYDSYNRGHDANVFIKNSDGTEYVGQVWPGNAVWADWQDPAANPYWANELTIWREQFEYDGIWIDMSEPSSFCTGSCGTETPQAGPVGPGERDINNPPYAINNIQGELSVKTVATNATHNNGVLEYDVHNLWGYQLLNATRFGLENSIPGKRPFIIGRSNFAGSGKWAGHWGGDNFAHWDNMYLSIPQALTFSMFAIPMFGVDTCGFLEDTTEELCNRWMQLSAFFPFYRNHYATGTLPQEPWRWESVTEASITAMQIRYSLLPYMYTLLNSVSTTGSPVMRALQWEFPADSSLAGADRQFLLGPALSVIPVLAEGATSVDGVFPGTEPWYDWYTQSAVPADWQGQTKTIDAPLGHIPLYVRAGYVLPMQQPAYTTTESRRNPWEVLVALGSAGSATGDLYLDDGESISPSETQEVAFSAADGKLAAKVTGNFAFEGTQTPLSNVTIMGVQSFGGSATFNGQNLESVQYDQDKKLLSITSLDEVTQDGAWNSDWEISWQ